jgi:hypothetical protein
MKGLVSSLSSCMLEAKELSFCVCCVVKVGESIHISPALDNESRIEHCWSDTYIAQKSFQQYCFCNHKSHMI